MALPLPAQPAVEGLPAQPVFVGRDQELDELANILNPAAPVHVGIVSTVSGLGGVGKTALALQAAHRAINSGWFPGGAILADLRGYDPPERRTQVTDSLATVLQAIGVPYERIPNGQAARELLWRSVLSERAAAGLSTLILLDNASSSEQVQPFLVDNAAHRFMITSRHNLGIQGARLLGLEILSPCESLAQLERELTAAHPDDGRCSIESDLAVEIVELCGRLPLAIHIAAALLTVTPKRPLSDLVGALRDERNRLSELTFDDSLAVRVAFDLSYIRLSVEQAHLFRMMTINPGPDAGVEAIAALSGFDVEKARRMLTQLARAHLVFPCGATRWGMHDLVRIYASERAKCDPEYAEALDRMLSYYLSTAQDADICVRFRTDSSTCSSGDIDTYEVALAWLDAEYQSAAASVTLALTGERYEYAADLPAVMCNYFHMRRRWSDWIATHRAALIASLELGDLHREARTRNNLGIAYRETGLFVEAIEQHREAVKIFHSLRDFRSLVGAQGNIGLAYLESGDPQEAADQIEQTLQFADLVNDPYSKARALVNLGLAFEGLGRYEEAVEVMLNSIALFQECGDRRSEAMTFTNLTTAYRELGAPQAAEEMCCQAIELAKGIDDVHLRVCNLNILGQIKIASSDFQDARPYHLEALTLSRSMGDRQNEGEALFGLAVCSASQQDWYQAAAFYRECLQVESKLGRCDSEAYVLNNLGGACFRLELFDEAAQHWRRALRLFSSVDSDFARRQAAEIRVMLEWMSGNEMSQIRGVED